MRRSVIAGLLAAVLVVSGCSNGNDDASSSPSPSTGSSAVSAKDAKSHGIGDITVAGKSGKEPTVDFKAPLVAKDSSKIVHRGKGKPVKKGQLVSANMTMVSGNTGKTLQSNYGLKKSAQFPMDSKQISPALFKAVKGANIGSRILLLLNASAQQGQPQQTLVYVIDVTGAKTIPTRAKGTSVPPKKGLPKVKLAKDGKPSISVPKSKAPTKLTVQPLIKGKGKVVKAGDNLTVKYTGVLWKNGKEFDSSWGKSPSTYTVQNIGQARVIKGWNKGLVGQTVGSQVLLVVPPSMGYGKDDNNGIPGGSTLVFVVDILSADS
ncbi:FKBP-type peptidyl-prolyl cis-trans isomerase [Spelaeicoccus albus]|uniref:Peptidyl-prolyl cis-trans isomerase n=1 Tax=Spelaeicoccus albus TaxID=1280376 RepID=A0A7Z0D3X5_9MICO|nr:FKBP-type peptidyl-prolyl cis-trans isomerase [Spelaeicoccus albus]NYI68411.1 peptidylprolyl isomerase [Spelaeicoccus albus]